MSFKKLEGLLGSTQQRHEIITAAHDQHRAELLGNLAIAGSGVPHLPDVLYWEQYDPTVLALFLDNIRPIPGAR